VWSACCFPSEFSYILTTTRLRGAMRTLVYASTWPHVRRSNPGSRFGASQLRDPRWTGDDGELRFARGAHRPGPVLDVSSRCWKSTLTCRGTGRSGLLTLHPVFHPVSIPSFRWKTCLSVFLPPSYAYQLDG